MLYKYSGEKIFKIVNYDYLTRSNNIDLVYPQFRTSLFKNSVLCFGPKLFNNLSLHTKSYIQTIIIASFKKHIKQLVRENER